MEKSSIFLHIDSSLKHLLRKPPEHSKPLIYSLKRRASIKDILEALGIPHTEVGSIVKNGEESGFDTIAQANETFEILPTSCKQPVTEPTVLRPVPITKIRFMVDINVGKLARLLRMAGYDAESVPSRPLKEIARQAVATNRIVLTRNTNLLKVKEVAFGHLLRSQDSWQQFCEVIELYNLSPDEMPFSRCLNCNVLLVTVAKEQILDQLEPLTRKYYRDFKQCPCCGLIFWRGSHHEKMDTFLRRLLPAKRI